MPLSFVWGLPRGMDTLYIDGSIRCLFGAFVL